MERTSEICTIQMQLRLNSQLYEAGVIAYDVFSKVNEILNARLEHSLNDKTAS